MIARDEDFFYELALSQRIDTLAATYTAYVEMTPNNKKPISQRDFYIKFKDNWEAFAILERDNSREDK